MKSAESVRDAGMFEKTLLLSYDLVLKVKKIMYGDFFPLSFTFLFYFNLYLIKGPDEKQQKTKNICVYKKK